MNTGPIRHRFNPLPNDESCCQCGQPKDLHGEPCPSCLGSGAADGSDNVNSVPCQACDGQGVRADALFIGERIDWSTPKSPPTRTPTTQSKKGCEYSVDGWIHASPYHGDPVPCHHCNREDSPLLSVREEARKKTNQPDRWVCESCDNYNTGPTCAKCRSAETPDHAAVEALAADLGDFWCSKIREHHGDPEAHFPSLDEYGRADRQAWLAVARRAMLLLKPPAKEPT